MQAFPLSKLTALSPEVPPITTKTFLFFFIQHIILISNSRSTPVFILTDFLTLLINFSISAEVAFPLFTKKLQCFFEITASPSLKLSHPVSLMISQAFFQINIFKSATTCFYLTWLSYFLFKIMSFCIFSIISFDSDLPFNFTEVIISFFDKFTPL